MRRVSTVFSIFGTKHRDEARFRLALGSSNSSYVAVAFSRKRGGTHESRGGLQLSLGGSFEA
jgi:hypothetical protein